MLNKIVNGVEVECTPEEVAALHAEWAANEESNAKLLAEQKAIRESALTKIAALGLTTDEIKSLIG